MSWSGLIGQVHNFTRVLGDFSLLALLSLMYGFHSGKIAAAALAVLFSCRKDW